MKQLSALLLLSFLLTACNRSLDNPDLIYGTWQLDKRRTGLLPDPLFGNRTITFNRDGYFRYDRLIGGDCVNRFTLEGNRLRLRGLCGIGGRYRVKTLSADELTIIGTDDGETVRLEFRR